MLARWKTRALACVAPPSNHCDLIVARRVGRPCACARCFGAWLASDKTAQANYCLQPALSFLPALLPTSTRQPCRSKCQPLAKRRPLRSALRKAGVRSKRKRRKRCLHWATLCSAVNISLVQFYLGVRMTHTLPTDITAGLPWRVRPSAPVHRGPHCQFVCDFWYNSAS